MNRRKYWKGRMRLGLLKAAGVVVFGTAIAAVAVAENPPQVATSLDSAHVFLNFSAGKSKAESPTTALNYMAAIDPGQNKVNFTAWLLNAGFISDPSQWKSTGQQTYTSVPGDYGYGKINAFAHIIILNAADLGFIRNQYIRCIPDCKTKNAKIYTYLENYPPTQFAKLNPDGTPDTTTQFTSTPEAISIALERRSGRIADVAFEWAPAANGSSPGTNFGQIYAYVVQPQLTNIQCPSPGSPTGTAVLDSSNNPVVDEQYVWPSNGGANQALWDCKFNNRVSPTHLTLDANGNVDLTKIGYLNPRPDFAVHSFDDFAPELDQLGTKQMPGVCLICHGGNIPANLATTQSWGATGQISEFHPLPADADNSIFGVDRSALGPISDAPGAYGQNMTQPAQETELKKYAQAVALTAGATLPKSAIFNPDGTIGGGQWGVGSSPSHELQVLFGWYNNGNDSDYSMPGTTQNGHFTPIGWRGSAQDTTLYQHVIKLSCRSCHLNREPSLDFRTAAQFKGEKGNVQDYVFQPECDALNHRINPHNIVMPLAKITWERFWNGIDFNADTGVGSKITLPINGIPTTAKTDLTSQVNLLKAYFGYTPTSYCAAHH